VVLGTILSIALSGFLIGMLARWAVPGPDPMPIWLTMTFGFGGSAIGGGITAAILGVDTKNVSSSDYFAVTIASIGAAMALIVVYRRLVQKRAIGGIGALHRPTPGAGFDRLREKVGLRSRPRGSARAEMLAELDELHDQGDLSDEEYLERRRKLLRGES
jgi:uncharacterized membrane protein YeaQ/YmgE (transglycosylase-associated protein family)